ncbi:MAG TPA: putative oxidoreductase C-terminal domain-containing protein [Verrucomicrobiota bacterium]|nr:putative oxidoreductase C-terminal domain-containing protein [Verrucomicrobiota bacterium]HQL77212.1 putative oxidoreductase C-terminal domain-containing protein [Verrucomicrobiota bacterium]
MNLAHHLSLLALCAALPAVAGDSVRLITLDPGHFHAGLVQKTMYPQVSPVVHVYAPAGPDLQEHLKRIEGFNTRADQPTHWKEQVYTGPDFLRRMLRDRAGNVVVLAGNNARKTDYINRSVSAGFNVLADKPMAITPANFDLLCKAFRRAADRKVLLYDIMTERYEITSMLQRELARMPELFGTMQPGTPEQPAVVIESVHYFFKEVAGKPLIRPAWFYDVRQQGESIPDVGTHLVDAVQWICFPDQALDWRRDIQVYHGRRWSTRLTPEQFKRSTGQDRYPDYFKKDIGPDGALEVYANGEVGYALRGIHARVTALWGFQAPAGAGDTHYALVRGTRCNLLIQQGAEQNYKPALYVENKSSASAAQFEQTVRAAVARLNASWPGVDLKPAGASWEITIPDQYRVSHEQHFAQVTEKFLGYLAAGRMPEWEVPNMLAKYYTTTQAHRLSHKRK